jgi:hypothetical protein
MNVYEGINIECPFRILNISAVFYLFQGHCMATLINIKLETFKPMLQAQGTKVLDLCGNQLRIFWGMFH